MPDFEDLPRISFVVETPAVQVGDVTISRGMIRYPGWTTEIDAGLRILREFQRAHDEEMEALGERRTDDDYFAVLDDRAFIARQVGRVGGYVVFATTLSGIVERSCAQLHGLLVTTKGANEAALKASREQLERKLAPIFTVRHKVFAHTAAVQPPPPWRPPDSFSVRASSVPYFGGTSVGWNGDELEIGAMRFGEIGASSPFADLPAMSMKRASISSRR